MAIKGKHIKIRGGSGEFDCYVVNPEIIGKLPAVVVGHGINALSIGPRSTAWTRISAR